MMVAGGPSGSGLAAPDGLVGWPTNSASRIG